MDRILFCTICAERLEVDGYDLEFEINLVCKNGHKWWYCMNDLEMGNFLAFQCGQGHPEIEAIEAAETIREKLKLFEDIR